MAMPDLQQRRQAAAEKALEEYDFRYPGFNTLYPGYPGDQEGSDWVVDGDRYTRVFSLEHDDAVNVPSIGGVFHVEFEQGSAQIIQKHAELDAPTLSIKAKHLTLGLVIENDDGSFEVVDGPAWSKSPGMVDVRVNDGDGELTFTYMADEAVPVDLISFRQVFRLDYPPQDEQVVKLRLTLDVEYGSNGTDPEDLRRNLEYLVANGAANGMLTGETAAEVETYDFAVRPTEVRGGRVYEVRARDAQLLRIGAQSVRDLQDNETGWLRKPVQDAGAPTRAVALIHPSEDYYIEFENGAYAQAYAIDHAHEAQKSAIKANLAPRG